MEKIKINTVKELKDSIKDLPDDLPVGKYCAGFWNPTFYQGRTIAVLPEGLAIDIDYSLDY